MGADEIKINSIESTKIHSQNQREDGQVLDTKLSTEKDKNENNEKNNKHNETFSKNKKGILRITGRIPWSNKEKNIVLDFFKHHVENKITPKKHECNQFLLQHGEKLHAKDWVRVKTFVYNSFRQKYD